VVITLAACLFSFGFAQDQSRALRPVSAQSADEAALRRLAEEFYAAYPKKDLDGFLRLWSGKSPELASRQQAMPQFFANYAQIEVKGLTIRHMTLDGEKARLRVSFEVSLIEAQTGKPAPTSGKRIRALHCAKEEGQWKVWREMAAAEELAALLIKAKPEEEQAALIAEEKELVTEELPREMNRQGWRSFLQSDYPEALAYFRLAQRIATQIGDQAGLASSLNFIGIIYNRQGNPSAGLEYLQRSFPCRLSDAGETMKSS
jgi:tetratricopeptide (TPR) repeat protein